MFSRLEPRNPHNRLAGWLARKENARRADAEDVLEEWGFVAGLGEQLVACFPNAWRALVITMLHVPIVVLALDAGLDQAPVPAPVLVAATVAWLPVPAVALLGLRRLVTREVPHPGPHLGPDPVA